MSISVQGSSGVDAQTETLMAALRTTVYPPSGDAFTMSAQSGLITTIAAGTTTAGHLYAFRNLSATDIVVERFRIRWQTITAFTTAQEIGLQAFIGRSFSTSYTGGTALTACKKRNASGNSILGDARISTTTALTAGTITLESSPFLELVGWSQTGVAPAVSGFEEEISFDTRMPIVLVQNEGIIVRNTILMGSAGTARVKVDLDWREVADFPPTS